MRDNNLTTSFLERGPGYVGSPHFGLSCCRGCTQTAAQRRLRPRKTQQQRTKFSAAEEDALRRGMLRYPPLEEKDCLGRQYNWAHILHDAEFSVIFASSGKQRTSVHLKVHNGSLSHCLLDFCTPHISISTHMYPSALRLHAGQVAQHEQNQRKGSSTSA